jgi:hypothetical protein
MKKINIISVLIFVSTVCFAQKQEIKLPLTFHNELSVHSDRYAVLDHTQELSDTFQIANRDLTNLRIGRISIYQEGINTGWDRSFRSSFRYVFGTDKKGKEQLIIDKNNNSDFSDDTVFVADSVDRNTKISADKWSKVNVEYDYVEQGKKVKQSINVYIVYNRQAKLYFYTLAQHATAILNGKKLEIVPSSDLSYLTFEVFNNSSFNSEGITSNK